MDKGDLFLESLRHHLKKRHKEGLLIAKPLGWKNVERFLKLGPWRLEGQKGPASLPQPEVGAAEHFHRSRDFQRLGRRCREHHDLSHIGHAAGGLPALRGHQHVKNLKVREKLVMRSVMSENAAFLSLDIAVRNIIKEHDDWLRICGPLLWSLPYWFYPNVRAE